MHNIFTRLKADFQLSIITLVGACSIVGISPYALFRLSEGNLLVGLIDSILVITTMWAVYHAWRTGNTVRPGQVLAFIYSTGTVMVATQLGVNGLFWFYNLILFNFFVVPPVQSVVATLLALVILCAYGLVNPGTVFESVYQLTSFAVTCLIASLFAFVFAYRARLQRRELSELALIDPLTGAGNRRTMDDELELAFAGYQREGKSYGLLVLDLDHFKAVNDEYGHKAGDRVLTDFVSIIRTSCRQSDRIFRLGGEEFVVLMPLAHVDGLNAAASQLVGAVARRLRSPGGAVTVSIGGCMLCSGHSSPEAWVHQADECLYEAKRRGRNTWVIFQPGTKLSATVPNPSGAACA